MAFSRSNVALIVLNAAWLGALSFYIARQVGNREMQRVEYVTNYVHLAKAPRVTTVVTNIIASTNEFRWEQLESEDYQTYIERLRAIGCPEQTIRDIIIADVDKLLAPRFAEVSLQPGNPKYWEPFDPTAWDDTAARKAMADQRLLDFHKREVIRQLLGIDLVGERLKAVVGQQDYYGARLTFLPEEKRARVRLVIDEFGDKERALLEREVEEGSSAALAAELQQVRQLRETALTETLTPAEREQYDLWFSPAAARTREAVAGMNATEEEFLKLYHLRRELDSADSGSDEEFARRAEQVLGKDRFADFARAQDPVYRELVAVAKRHGLPQQLAVDLHGYKKMAEEQRALVAADGTLTPEQKNAAERAIADETDAAFKEALGDNAFHMLSRRRAVRQ